MSSRWWGRAGMLLAFLLWTASIGALLVALRANEAAGLLAREHGRHGLPGRLGHLEELAVMWCVAMAALQIASLVVGAFVLRVVYRLRAAVCFAVSGSTLVGLNALWLLGLLVWLRVYGETM